MSRTIAEATEVEPAKIHLRGEPKRRDPLIRGVGQTLAAELQGAGVGERLYADSVLNILMLHLLRHYSTLPTRSETRERFGLPGPQLRRAIEAIRDQLEAGISLAEIAEAAGVSTSHFAALFRASTGLAPHQYLIRCRVERAKELLACEDVSLAQVAARAGFCDQSHLTRHFKRLVGLTPAVYRRLP